MKIAVVGGTQFVGRHFVDRALRRGHAVTLFHRGKTNPGLFEEADEVFGDRTEEIERLGGDFDVAVDTSGYTPSQVRPVVDHLEPRVDRYLFVSTTAVYRDLSKPGVDEDAYLKTLEDPELDELNRSTYGPLKTECEAVVTGAFDHRSLIVRPGVLAGPHDPTDRFTYWACRVADGGEVLAPGPASSPVQLLDARDLAKWLVDCVEEETTGTFNAAGPSISFEAMLEACRSAADSDATFTWVSPEFMNEVEIDVPSKMPLWNREYDGRKAGLYAVDSSRALARGLSRRPLEETARDVWRWSETRESDRPWEVGLDRLQEREILDVWHRN